MASRGTIDCTLYRLDVSDREYEGIVRRINEMMRCSSMYKYTVLGMLICKMDIAHQRSCHYFSFQFRARLWSCQTLWICPSPISYGPYDYVNLPRLIPEYSGPLGNLKLPLAGRKGCYAKI